MVPIYSKYGQLKCYRKFSLGEKECLILIHSIYFFDLKIKIELLFISVNIMSSFSKTYFPKLNHFAHNDIFQDIKQVWDPLKKLDKIILKLLAEDLNGDPLEKTPGLILDSSSSVKGIAVERWIKLETPIISKTLGIWIGSGTILEPTAIIKGPAIIGKDNEIRQGAYIRGGILMGDNCVIGHCTEIKNSILMNHVEAGHFNYIGDSILGSFVNMGAGSRLANVQFRRLEEKMNDFINVIEIPMEGKLISTELTKFGAIIGDNVEVGCNAVICPGALIAKDNWIYPNCTVPKGFHAPGHFITPSDRKLRKSAFVY